MRTGSVPLAVRVAMAHAALQHLAESQGIDVLHIKGPALDAQLIRPGRESTDADVLVRASDAPAFVATLQQAGWDLRSRFENSSAFQHSATLWHHLWGYADVHRHFPGIGIEPDAAFERLWVDHGETAIAEVRCAVPGLAGQTLVLLLHAAREGGSPRSGEDVRTAWDEAPAERRAEVLALVDELDAGVAFAAATGTLEEHRGARDHDLWAISTHGGTRAQEWRARIKAAPTRREAARLALRAVLVNTDHLAMVRGHRPSVGEVVVEFFARPARGLRESLRSSRSGGGGS